MRKHIGKALKARSEAIRTAVKNYNLAATRLKPPRDALDVNTVLEHVYIAQFDLLRGSRLHIAEQPWVQPAEREALTAYYKLQGSHNEIKRLNVEIRRFSTWLEDQEHLMHDTIEELMPTNPALGTQLIHRLEHFLALNTVHRSRLAQLQALPGFTGDIRPGRRVGGLSVKSELRTRRETVSVITLPDDESSDDDDGKVDEDSLALVDDTFEVIHNAE